MCSDRTQVALGGDTQGIRSHSLIRRWRTREQAPRSGWGLALAQQPVPLPPRKFEKPLDAPVKPGQDRLIGGFEADPPYRFVAAVSCPPQEQFSLFHVAPLASILARLI
jgi:hypothetical protein